MKNNPIILSLAILLAQSLAGCESRTKNTDVNRSASEAASEVTLLNVSYDPTREFYQDFNQRFAEHWQREHHQKVTVRMSHGGSGKQARAVIDGLDADIVTLALAYDVDALRVERQLIPEGWIKRLPQNSAPYTSTIVFLVRQGNPKGIKDWGDLVRDGISVITPNPKTSGGARWNYLAAYAWAKRQPNGSDATATAFIRKLYRNVPVLDSGARGSSTTFSQNNIGDVLIAWENEAFLLREEMTDNHFEMVIPSLSILAEPSVAWVDAQVKKHGTEAVAKAYLEYLYTPEIQELAAKHHYRPRNETVMEKYRNKFSAIQLVTVDEAFGGWEKAQKIHFADNGLFDQVYASNQGE